jgi:hypothetical protein
MPNMLRCKPVLGVLLGALGLSSACDSSLVSPNPDPTELSSADLWWRRCRGPDGKHYQEHHAHCGSALAALGTGESD